MPDLIHVVLRRLRDEQGLSRSQLSRKTVTVGSAGVPEATIQALETYVGRVPDAEIIEALATALGVEPGSFYEYPIAVARRDGRRSRRPARRSLLDARIPEIRRRAEAARRAKRRAEPA